MKPYHKGNNQIVEMNPGSKDLSMGFSMLILAKGQIYENDADFEREFLLIGGEAELTCGNTKAWVSRRFWRDDAPACLSVCCGCPVKLTGKADRTEIAVFMASNKSKWFPTLITNDEIKSTVQDAGILDDSAQHISREIVSRQRIPASRINIEEVLLQPGKWGGPQQNSYDCASILFLKYYPDNGFGILCTDKQAYYMDNDSAMKLQPGEPWMSVCAPGYTQYMLVAKCCPE